LGRPWRIEFEGALYHVTDRGVEKREIFIEVDDYRKFIFYLGRAAEHFNLLIHGFCLIPNHYHLECETPNANLSRAMQWLNTSYAVYFNRRHDRVGHVFQGRYYSTLVQKERHLLELTRYIHLNPVRAGLVRLPQEYEWSSYRIYVGGSKEFGWLETDWTLSQFGDTRLNAQDAYRSFVEEGLEADLTDPLELAVDGILGDDVFFSGLREKLKKDELLDLESIGRRRSCRAIPVERIVEAVSSTCSVVPDQVRRKGGHRNAARDAAVYLARVHSGLTNAEVAAEFGRMRGSNVSNICRKIDTKLRTDRNLARIISEARRSLLGEGQF
jgi:REP element-mobilizing transposase RayT